ncbi:MAG: dehydrogenase [Bacteroides sp. SM23_62]|jgi:D-glycero-alpha-D-manno-heptose-7-phosphate kinase|nr:MAG: dehydrogenase [Bacteroides sp. SM23_62]
MKYISRAPLRIGLAGGGTDVAPYCDIYSGAVLNATIDLFATVVLIPRDDNKVIFYDLNAEVKFEFEAKEKLEDNPEINLQIGVYNRIVKDYSNKALPCEIIFAIDAPTGSGLGTSSTLVIALIGAFVEWLKLPLGEYDIAHLGVSIEREDLQFVGGKQDQYAATFGGFNFMEFHKKNRIIVNPLRIKPSVIKELEFHLLLFYTQINRESARIIEVQKANVERQEKDAIEATHQLKDLAYKMKEAILKDELFKIGEVLKSAWGNKKLLATGISNRMIEDIYETAIKAGASGGKISGAGGGGFMIFYCPGNSRFNVIKALKAKGITQQKYTFHPTGLDTWTSQQ